MKRKIIGSLSIIMGVFIIAAGFAMAFEQGSVYALEVVGRDMGLEIISSGIPLFDAGNMNPGDTEEAVITVKNQGESPFGVEMSLERVGEVDADPDLFDQLDMKITYLGDILYEGKMSGFTAPRSLGNFQPKDSRNLTITVHLPGPETGNEYQGKSVSVKFVFTARWERPVPPGGDETRLVIAKQIVDSDFNNISDIDPFRSETFYVSINGEEPRAFSPAEPVILEGLEVGSTYTIEEVGLAPDSAYVCLTEPVTVTVGPFAEYVVITNQYQDSDFVVPPDPPETGGEDDEQDVIVEPELPRTDSMGIYLLLLGLILVIVGFRLQAGTRKS